MIIDGFTVAAQAINFLVLVFLLRRFLYQPVLDAIDAREARIAGSLAEAATTLHDATARHAEFDRKNGEFDEARAARMAEVEDTAAAEGARLLTAARAAADALGEQRRRALADEARSLNEAVRQRTVEEVFLITRKVLADLATASLEERVVAVFTRRLGGLDPASKGSFAAAIAGGPEVAVVRSAFPLPPDQRAVVQNAVNETFAAAVDLRFEAAPALISGIELTANGQKLGWSVDTYLGALQQDVDALWAPIEEAHVA